MILNLLPYCDNWLYDIYDILLNVEKYKYFHITLTPCKNINKKYEVDINITEVYNKGEFCEHVVR